MLHRPSRDQYLNAIANLGHEAHMKLLGGIDLLVSVLLGLEVDSLKCRLTWN